MEIETQGCTSISYNCKEFFLRYYLEEGPHDIPMWKGAFTSEDVANHIRYILEKKSANSSIEWVDRCIIEMNTLRGKIFLFLCIEVFVLPDIYLTCEKQQRNIM